MGVILLAAGTWGFAEATLFFLVPDLLLTWVALRDDGRRAWPACLAALVGALLGGAAMFAWGVADPAAALATLARVPAIDRALCAEVADQIRRRGPLALAIGPATGVPYKIYAVQAGALGIGPGAFLLASVPARLGRFLLAVGLTRLAVRASRGASLRARRTAHIALWSTFYAAFFLWARRPG